jgi:hypothetical protein
MRNGFIPPAEDRSIQVYYYCILFVCLSLFAVKRTGIFRYIASISFMRGEKNAKCKRIGTEEANCF